MREYADISEIETSFKPTLEPKSRKIKAIGKALFGLTISSIFLVVSAILSWLNYKLGNNFYSSVILFCLLVSLVVGYITIAILYKSLLKLYQYQKLLQIENHLLEEGRINILQAAKQQAEIKHMQAEQEKRRAELLLQDASHRVGNSLATVASLLTLQMRKTTNMEVRNALGCARDRIQTISTAHRRLRLGESYDKAPVKEFLTAVVNDAYATLPNFVSNRITLKLDIQPLELPGRDVTTIGIILGELVINAFKHAFPDDTIGYVKVVFGYQEGKLQLIVEDNGKGSDIYSLTEKKQKGLGQLIVEQLSIQVGDPVIFSHLQQHSPFGTRVCVSLSKLQKANFNS